MNPKDSPFTSQLNQESDHLASAMDEAKATVNEAKQDLKAIASDESARIGTQLLDWLNRNASLARDTATSLREEAVALGDRTQRYMRDEPVRSALMAAAAGAVIAGFFMMLGRRRS